MRELSLFTGAGGGLLATKHLLGWTTIGYVEIEPYCQAIIRQRISDGLLDSAPIFSDIRDFIKQGYAEAYQGMVDVITAGFPCQPFSVANRGQDTGEKSDRNLWPETLETIRHILPKYIFLENVSNLTIHKYFGKIIGQISKSGYRVKWKIISANEVGAPHLRERVWIFATNTDCIRSFPSTNSIQWNEIQNYEIWNPTKNIPKNWEGWINWFSKVLKDGNQIGADSANLGVYNGVPNRLDAIKALGNAQVPQVAATAWEILKP